MGKADSTVCFANEWGWILTCFCMLLVGNIQYWYCMDYCAIDEDVGSLLGNFIDIQVQSHLQHNKENC